MCAKSKEMRIGIKKIQNIKIFWNYIEDFMPSVKKKA